MADLDKLRALKLRTGYNIVQVYAQRKMGPPPFWSGPPPPRGCEIFVGKLPRDVFEYDLFPLFENVGLVYEFRLIMEFSGFNKGYAFVTYASKSDSQKAIALLNGYEIRPGIRIGVLKSIDNLRLYLSYLPNGKSKEEIFAEISTHTDGVVNVLNYCRRTSKTKNQGSAIVEYESHYAASLARKILIPEQAQPFGCCVKADWAVSEEILVVVRNIPLHINDSYMKDLFSFHKRFEFDAVKKFETFALVHYYSLHDVEGALTKLNGLNVDGCPLQVSRAKLHHVLLFHDDNYPVEPNLSYSKPHRKQKKVLTGIHYYPHNSFLDNPVKWLSYICQTSGWGEPIYHVTHVSSSADENETTYIAKVYIPDLPHPKKYFTFSAVFTCPRDAKYQAAESLVENFPNLNRCRAPSSLVLPDQHKNFVPANSNTLPKSIWNSDSIWNSSYGIQSPLSFECPSPNDDFLGLLASAVSLANAELQSKEAPEEKII